MNESLINCTFDTKLNYYLPEEALGGGYEGCEKGYQSMGEQYEYCVEKIPEWKCAEISGAAYWNAQQGACICDNEPDPWWNFNPTTGEITCNSH